MANDEFLSAARRCGFLETEKGAQVPHKRRAGLVARNVSSKVLLRPTLPAGGLPALSRGQMSSWSSPVIYHVHNFGTNNDAGPDDGWNVTVLSDVGATVDILRVLYGRLLDVQPRPEVLTYLAHNANGSIILSHYITTSGASGFDQILKIVLSSSAPATTLRETWPTFLTITGREDSMKHALRDGEKNVEGVLHVYDEQTGLPRTVEISLDVTLDYYKGSSDGFAGFGTMCPSTGTPPSPTTCGM
eukprot:g2111.t1